MASKGANGGADGKANARCADINRLLPCFVPVVERLLAALTERRFKPVLFETYRSPERAAMLAKRGTGSARSMHTHGAAVDVICGEHQWSCSANGCEFFAAVGEVAKSLGLTWGGEWRMRDLPHVQCVTVGQQEALRALATWEAKDAFVKARLKSLF
jgi:hypothetical protein